MSGPDRSYVRKQMSGGAVSDTADRLCGLDAPGFVVDSAPYFVESLVSEPHHVEGVCHLQSVGQHPVVGCPIGS